MIVALDVECSGLNFWEKNFKLLSMSIAWRTSTGSIRSKFYDTLVDIEGVLEDILENNHSIVVYNAGYDIAVLQICFPNIHLNWVDSQRLVQLNGLPSTLDKKDRKKAFSLVKSSERILNANDWKQTFKEYIRENLHVKKGDEYNHLDKLPRHVLESYNNEDAVRTLQLYEVLTAKFAGLGYDWTVDHDMYKRLVKYTVESQIRGINVNRTGLAFYAKDVKKEIEGIGELLNATFPEEILKVRQILLDKKNSKLKRVKKTELPEFKMTSTQHLALLCVNVMGMAPKFFTNKNAPSFKVDYLAQWGEVGAILAKKGKRGIVLNQCLGLLEESKTDDRLHYSVKLVSTVTGRSSSGKGN